MNEYFNVGDKVKPKKHRVRSYLSAEKTYEVVTDPADDKPSIIDEGGDYIHAYVDGFDLVENTQSEETEESLTGSFYIDINEYDGTMGSIINAICESKIALQSDFYDNCIEVKVSAPASLTKKQKLNKQGFTDEQIKKIESVLGEI